MKYQNANSILPEHLIEELQKYLQGEYLYVPAPKETQKGWGERSGLRKEIDYRNERIQQKYHAGVPIEELAEDYFLSIHSIRKIIYTR